MFIILLTSWFFSKEFSIIDMIRFLNIVLMLQAIIFPESPRSLLVEKLIKLQQETEIPLR